MEWLITLSTCKCTHTLWSCLHHYDFSMHLGTYDHLPSQPMNSQKITEATVESCVGGHMLSVQCMKMCPQPYVCLLNLFFPKTGKMESCTYKTLQFLGSLKCKFGACALIPAKFKQQMFAIELFQLISPLNQKPQQSQTLIRSYNFELLIETKFWKICGAVSDNSNHS